MLENNLGFVVDMIGKRYGRLLVIERAGKVQGGIATWKCRCDCGKEAIVRGAELRRGHVISCGCYRVEQRTKHTALGGGAHTSWLYSKCKSDAKRKGIIFDLSNEDFVELISGACFCCGRKGTNTMRHSAIKGEYKYNGIDRIDSTLGYVRGNVRSACWRCNRAKNDTTDEEYWEWLRLIMNHNREYFVKFFN